MTVLQGNYYVVEGLSDFMDILNVSTAEAIEATDTSEQIIKCHNEISEEDINDPTEAHPDNPLRNKRGNAIPRGSQGQISARTDVSRVSQR
jgi:sensor c-di-GMP phosphodiesterase-like protein